MLSSLNADPMPCIHLQLVEYDRQCSLFLERMRHASSFELVQKFKSFVNVFVGTQYSTADACSKAVHDFIEVNTSY